MAEERKTGPAPDDWDSLPLDPAADDWDAPPAKPEKQAPEKAEEAPFPPVSDDDFDDEAPGPESPPVSDDDFDDEAPGPLDSVLDGLGDEDDDFDTPSPAAAEFPEPEPPELEAPKPEAPEVPEPPPAAPKPPPKLPPPPPPGAFDAFLGDNAGKEEVAAAPAKKPAPPPEPDLEDKTASPPPDPEDESSEGESPESEPPEDESPDSEPDATPHPIPPKVELDIEGIFLDELISHPPQDAEAAAEEPAPAAKKTPAPPAPAAAEKPASPAPAPAEEPPEAAPHHKVPFLKLLTLVVPAILILIGLGWAVHRLFIHTPPPPPQVLVIDPSLPPHEPEPGEVPLKPFYINFAGEPEVIVEMSAVLYYNDISDRELIVENLPSVREVIFRITRSKGSEVVTNGGIQRALRQELLQAANEVLGAKAISYVQLTQFRILH